LRKISSLIILVGLTITSGCQDYFVDSGAPLEVNPSQTAVSVVPTQGESSMTPSPANPAEPGLQNLIEKAIADLAQRFSVPADQIKLVEATPLVWPDSSLGCPQKGIVYAQVLTPGYLIRLNANNTEYEYHASRGTEVIYCENPSPPVQGTPGDI